jgi:hypothetical protein
MAAQCNYCSSVAAVQDAVGWRRVLPVRVNDGNLNEVICPDCWAKTATVLIKPHFSPQIIVRSNA